MAGIVELSRFRIDLHHIIFILPLLKFQEQSFTEITKFIPIIHANVYENQNHLFNFNYYSYLIICLLDCH